MATKLAPQKTEISAGKFIDEKLRLYSAHSNVRGIPFLGDGFKQAHRKAAWGMLKRGENAGEDTVERIAAASASLTDYHHGVGSFEGTIVNMAQDHAGSNNMPLFFRKGQFGNRLGKKPAGARYLKTKLHENFRKLFPKEDDLIFEHVISDGRPVEPRFFTPILPLVLLNGAEGMGTGHSCYILSYNPEDLKSAILKMLDGKIIPKHSLTPWWRGFNGKVSRDPVTGQVTVEGKYERKEGRSPTLRVTELPIGIQSDVYKEHLNKLEDRQIVVDHDNASDEEGFDFIVRVPRTTANMTDEQIKKLFKLVAKETENLTVWDGDGVLRRYECVEDLLTDFVIWRTERYEDRRQAQMKKIDDDILWANLKIRFIRYYLENYEYFRDTGTKQLEATLVKEGFDRHQELLSMPMRNLTRDKIAELEQDVEDLKKDLQGLQADNAIDMYTRELKALKL